MTRPRNILPASPRYIFAGSQLYFKNPSNEATMLMDNIEMIKLSLYKEMINMDVEAKTPIVAARPSIMSMIFMAFITVIIQANDNRVLSQGVRNCN
jgi:hypothetical protein